MEYFEILFTIYSELVSRSIKLCHVLIFASQYSNWVLTMKDQFKGHIAFLTSATANREEDHTFSTQFAEMFFKLLTKIHCFASHQNEGMIKVT